MSQHLLSIARLIWFRDEVYEVVKIAKSRLDILQELHSKISDWWSDLSPSLKLTADCLPTVLQQSAPLLLLLSIIYHQSLCAPHSSIVPLFSYCDVAENLSYARQISAQLAFEHVDAVSTLLKAVLKHTFDTSRTPSFVGYAAYSACAVQMPFFWCTNQDVQIRVRSNVLANLRMMQQMGRYWRFTALLVRPSLNPLKIAGDAY